MLVIYNNGLNGKCGVNCGSGFYYDTVLLSCNPCATGCTACTDTITCTSCENAKFLYLYQCLNSCPAGYVGISTLSENTCRKCPTNCAQCTYDQNSGLISCTQCINPLILFNSTCYTTCPSSTYLTNTSCNVCP